MEGGILIIALLIIATLAVLLYGYVLMHRLDLFFARGGFAKEPSKPEKKDLLLYCEPEELELLAKRLDKAQITYDHINEIKPGNGAVYRWVGAVSKNDYDNLLLCMAVKKEQPAIKSMAKCNNTIYETIFNQLNITMVTHDAGIDWILKNLEG